MVGVFFDMGKEKAENAAVRDLSAVARCAMADALLVERERSVPFCETNRNCMLNKRYLYH
jgi:hypothetical protein